MKTLKAFAKKPIAIVLAVLMIVGSVSVVAMADPDVTGKLTVSTSFKGYKPNEAMPTMPMMASTYNLNPGANPGDWKVKAGDIVQAEIRFTSDFPIGEFTLSFMFDNRVLENAWDTYGGVGNAKSMMNLSLVNKAVIDEIQDLDDLSVTTDSLVTEGYMTAEEAANLGGIYAFGSFGVNVTNPTTYSGDANSWVFRHQLKVKDADALRNYLASGSGALTYATFELLPNSTKSHELDSSFNAIATGNVSNYNLTGAHSSDMYVLNIKGESEHLVFGSAITLDAIDGYGKFSEDTDPEVITTTDIGGISGDNLTGYNLESDYKPNFNALDVDFIGYSTAKATGAQKDENDKPVFGGDYTKMITSTADGYVDSDNNPVIFDDQTLYAVYRAADTTYIVNVTFPDYTMHSDPQSGCVGDEVTIATVDDIPADINVAGYEIDTVSPQTLTLTADTTTNVIDVTLKAKDFTIDWTVPGATTPEKSEAITFGTDKGTAAHPDPKVVYTDTSSDNYGKYVKWADHEGTLDVAEDVHVTGTLEALPVKAILHNTDKNGVAGTFGTGATELDKAYGGSIAISEFATVEAPANYHIAGYVWDTVTETAESIPGTLDKSNYAFTAGSEDIPVLTTNIYPVFELNKGDVTFDANGGKFGESTDPITTKYTYDDNIIVPADPTKDSDADDAGVTQPLEFLGWNTDRNATEAGTVPTTFDGNDATYYAIWKDSRKAIEFLDKDNTTVIYTLKRNLDASNPYTITEEDKDNAAAKVTGLIEGESWEWDAPATVTEPIQITGHSLYRFVTEYTDAAGNKSNLVDESYAAGTPIIAAADPSAADETFSGWYDNAEYTDPVFAEPGASFNMPAAPLTIYGKAVKNNYTITYKVDGEVYGDVESYQYNAPITQRDLPAAKEGNSITGWTITAPEGTTEFPATMPMKDLVLEATNTPNKYRIVYVKPDGTLETVIEEDFGTDLSGKTAPDYEQYNIPGAAVTYTGWSMETLPATMPVYTDTFEVGGTTYTDAVKVTPVSQSNEKVTVKYIYADGTEAASLEDYPGATLSAPANTVEDGFTFEWSQNLTQFPASDTTVNETKTPKDVNVIVSAESGSTTSTETVPFDRAPTEPPMPSIPTGVDFEGWSTPDGIIIDFTKALKDQLSGYVPEITLTPSFSVSDKYYAVDGTDTDGNFTYKLDKTFKHIIGTADDSYTVPDAAEMEGFTFKYWSLDKTTDAAPTGQFADTTREFYPYYEINKHDVKYVSEGTTVEDYPDVAFASELPRPEDPTREGYVFGGWLDQDGKAPGDYATMPDKDLTFTAQWIIPGADYTITYYDREGRVYHTYTVHSGNDITDEYIPEDPQRFGFIFKGWDPEIPDVMPEENLEFNAIWEIDPKFVALVVGGVVVSGAVVGGVAAANAALITGAVIVGGVVVVGGIALAKHTHKVTYIVDGENYRVYYILEGAKVIVPKDPTKDGADFTGWTPEVPERMPANDLCFEATWSTDAADDGAAPVDDTIPDTGSATASLAAFAVISSAAAAAYVITRKKKED